MGPVNISFVYGHGYFLTIVNDYTRRSLHPKHYSNHPILLQSISSSHKSKS